MQASTNPEFKKLRTEMVAKAIFARGVRSDLVLERCVACRVKPSCRPGCGNSPTGCSAADRRRTDDLAALYRRVHDRSPGARRAVRRCSRSAPARATRRPCFRDCGRGLHGGAHRPARRESRLGAGRPWLSQRPRAARRRDARMAGARAL